MGIAIDSSFVIQVASFLILWVLLRRLLFAPILGVIEEREARTRGSRETAERLTVEAASLREEYEQRIRGVRQHLRAESEANRKTATEEERRVTAAARDAAALQLARVRREIDAQLDAARAPLAREAVDLGQQMAARLLGRAA